MELDQKTCVPCRGGVPPLTEREAGLMLAEVPEWGLFDGATRVCRRFTCEDFASAMGFVAKVGELAEIEGHHPDVTFGWGYAEIMFYTHKINGLHENDFILAAKIDRIA